MTYLKESDWRVIPRPNVYKKSSRNVFIEAIHIFLITRIYQFDKQYKFKSI